MKIPAVVLTSSAILGLGFSLFGQNDVRPPTGTQRSQQNLNELERRLERTLTVHGTLEASRVTEIRNQTGGERVIVSCVPEGQSVKAGDLLIELDVSDLEEELQKRRIELNLAQSLLEQANRRVDLQRAAADLQLKASESALALAEMELAHAETRWKAKTDRAKRTLELAKLKSQSLETQEVAEWQRKAAAFEELEAESNLQMLAEFDHPLAVQKLQLQIQQAQAAVAGQRSLTADQGLSAEELRFRRESEVSLAKADVARLEEAIERGRINAPLDGLVLYAISTSSRTALTSLEPGDRVREGQTLLRIPDLSEFQISARIHESVIPRVKVGQPAKVTCDGVPGKQWSGVVESIARNAETGRWPNSDRREFKTIVRLDEPNPSFRPGMTAIVEIEVEPRTN